MNGQKGSVINQCIRYKANEPVYCVVQAISRLCEDKYKDLSRAAMRRSFSADNLVGIRRSNAVLS